MNRKTVGLTTVFGLLLGVTATGILYHYLFALSGPVVLTAILGLRSWPA
ncbi:hypothetical protein [Limnochorda pilosa]|uniref:Uncharacterized protein n=1 Tax=Limnochorda pilosa TaxID=1555112 RepID=A0A0K2SH65_LIMPI|nr:hypothetical protein [Limnochorda pilosa]BAS26144.1 hypothetical protein LIP_0287 [Limnochorda pilosa]